MNGWMEKVVLGMVATNKKVTRWIRNTSFNFGRCKDENTDNFKQIKSWGQ